MVAPKNRILFVINSLASGGAERILTILANAWAAKGYQVCILTFEKTDSVPFYPLHPNISYIPLNIGTKDLPFPTKIFAIPKIIRSLKKSLIKNSPDLVISFMDQTNILTLWASSGLSIPVIVSERVAPHMSSMRETHMPWLVRALANPLRNFFYAKATHVVVQTKATVEKFPKTLRPQITVIPNPVTATQDDHADITCPKPCVVGLGRLVAQKRFDILIRAFTSLTDRFPSWNLVIAGEGPLRHELNQLITSLSMQGKIRIAGLTKSPHAFLRQGDLFVLSSDYEGFPGALCEAMANGLPVVASNCPTGPADIVRDSIDGFLVDPGQPENFSSAMERLMSSEELRRTFGLHAKEILSRFSLEKIIAQWEALFPIDFDLN